MDKQQHLIDFVRTEPDAVGRLIDIHPETEGLLHFDLTTQNPELTPAIVADTNVFAAWVKQQLEINHCKFGIGGYLEHRDIYARSALFDGKEPRRLHLGIDIWGEAGTKVYAPIAGHIHSFRDNNQFGDYGPTIVIAHNIHGLELFSLYGHLDRAALDHLYVGKDIAQGQFMARFGKPNENGNWPPHLHFQLMFDMQGHIGDYPGVCSLNQRDLFAKNAPDPDIVLQLMRWAKEPMRLA